MQTLFQDLRYATRQLIRNPGLTVTAVISLALGIGATTAVFSVIYAALINPYPYPAANRIVRLAVHNKATSNDTIDLSGPQIEQLQQLPGIEAVLAMDYNPMILTGHDLPENVNTIALISNGFTKLGVPPLLGRGLLPSDAPEGQQPQPVAVLSYKFWQKHFFGDPSVLGKTLQLDRKNYEIVGIAAPRFTWYSADVFLPLQLTQAQDSRYIIDILLKPGVTHDTANAELQPLLNQFARATPKQFPEHFNVGVEGLNEWVVRSIGGTLYLLFAAVGLLLAIGCGNVSILLLARGTARQHELAVRSAIGANRRRILRQLLTESLLLAAIGAALGVVLAYGILAAMRVLLPQYAFAPEVVIRINLPVLLFSVAAALATGILFGLWPALQLSRPQLNRMVLSGTRRAAGSVHGRRTHQALIAGQIALTLLLLAAAGSAMKGFAKLTHIPLGYDPHNIVSVGIPLHRNAFTTWTAREAYFEQLRAKVAETPGVIMTAISFNATPPRNGWNMPFDILGKPGMSQQTGSINFINPGYFSALRIPLVQGRLWTDAENRNAAHIAVINQTLARLFFPNGDAIGHSVKLPAIESRPPEVLSAPGISNAWLLIAGVVGDARNDGLKAPVKPAVYVPYTLSMGEGIQLLVRSNVPPLTLMHAIGKQVTAVNPEQQIYNNVESLDRWVADEPEWQQDHLVSWIFGLFASLGLALAAVGLYSVVSYTVVQRTNEFGIRMALGADRSHVLRIVFASTLISVGSGVLSGLVLTIGLNKILARWADGNAHDPIVLFTGTLLLCLVAGVACIIPAWRASQVNPMTALRCD